MNKWQLDRPDLFITDSWVGGKTVSAQFNQTFDVLGETFTYPLSPFLLLLCRQPPELAQR